jgi:hypothetical protein
MGRLVAGTASGNRQKRQPSQAPCSFVAAPQALVKDLTAIFPNRVRQCEVGRNSYAVFDQFLPAPQLWKTTPI